MKIQLFYFDGCPSWQIALQNLQAACAAEGLPADIELVVVAEDDQAAARGFLGSPSIVVDGQDLWPATGGETQPLGCRLYRTPEGLRGWPTVEMLRQALAKRILQQP